MAVSCEFSQDQCVEIDRIWQVLQGDDVQSQVSLCGSRTVRCNTGKTVSLVSLTNKILSLSHLEDLEDIPMTERIRGVEIVQKLRAFYDETDKMINVANLITRILFRIFEFFGANGTGVYGARWHLEDDFVMFRLGGFTPKQFEKYFQGKSPSGILFEGTQNALLRAPFGTMLGDAFVQLT
jgi:hypothetical protein